MSDVTRFLDACSEDPKAADELLPLVNQELHRLSAARRANESPGKRSKLLPFHSDRGSQYGSIAFRN
ncbi:MAG: transposase InsO family protein [Verrucomicrobiales bacterium]|jgi:transposase InsO family protein